MNAETETEDLVTCLVCDQKVDVEAAHFYARCDNWVCDECMEHRA